MLKKFWFLISILYTIVLTFVCLIKLNKLPDLGVSFADKIFHSLSYTLLSFLWYLTFLYRFNLKNRDALFYSFWFSVIFGIIIEVLQGTLTATRTFDFFDVLANTVGVFFTVLLVSIKKMIPIKKQ